MAANKHDRGVTRFLVWRTYHKLLSDMDRVPTTYEIADVLGLSRGLVFFHLKSLGLETRGHSEFLKPYEKEDHVPDVLEMMKGIEE